MAQLQNNCLPGVSLFPICFMYIYLSELLVEDRRLIGAMCACTQIGLDHCPLMLAWHGCSHEAALSICTHGAADIRSTDGGFFGTGYVCVRYL